MTPELKLLAWTFVLALVQILLPAQLRTKELGIDYNVSARDAPAAIPPGKITGRLERARNNLFETLVIFTGAILIGYVADIHTTLTYWGALLYFWARVAYVPVYAFGVPYLRTLIWLVSLAGIVLILTSVLLAV